MADERLNLNEIIWQIVASIPRGSVATYALIAKLSGHPNHARYIGTVLKRLPSDTTLPWHRVINSKGEISFPSGSESYKRQRTKLEQEGIVFNNKQRISLEQFMWRR